MQNVPLDAAVEGIPTLPADASVEEILHAQVDRSDVVIILLASILSELRKQVQQGFVYTLEYTVQPGAPQSLDFPYPLFAIALINNGGANIQYRTPDRAGATWNTIAPTDVKQYNFTNGLINSISVRLPPGGLVAVAVTIEGIY
jgi:hypothetical protein